MSPITYKQYPAKITMIPIGRSKKLREASEKIAFVLMATNGLNPAQIASLQRAKEIIG